MKILYTFFLTIMCIGTSNAQNEKSLDETKNYIVKIINEYGWKENSNINRLHAEFNGDLLKILFENKHFKLFESETIYNFANVYKYKGPIRRPGERGHVIIWVDFLANEGTEKWKKTDLEFDVSNYENAEQLMKAFRHLNELLMKSKPKAEKF